MWKMLVYNHEDFPPGEFDACVFLLYEDFEELIATATSLINAGALVVIFKMEDD